MFSSNKRKITAAVAGISALALALTACSSSSTSSTSSTSAAETSAARVGRELGAVDRGHQGVDPLVRHRQVDLWRPDRQERRVYATIVAPEDQPYVNSFKPFEECTGAKVTYEGSKEFEAQVVVRVQSGNPPDVAMFPQPGLLQQIVDSTGAVKPLQADTKEPWVTSTSRPTG